MFYFLPGESQLTTNLSASGEVQENDVIVMTCSVTYSGKWAPEIRWTDSKLSGNFPQENINSTTIDTMVTSQLRFVASKDLDGSMIICETYFGERPSGLSTTADNVPTYTDTQTSSTLKVMGK